MRFFFGPLCFLDVSCGHHTRIGSEPVENFLAKIVDPSRRRSTYG
jgi:hypothetical protein